MLPKAWLGLTHCCLGGRAGNAGPCSAGNPRHFVLHVSFPAREEECLLELNSCSGCREANVTKYTFLLYIGVSRKMMPPCSPLGCSFKKNALHKHSARLDSSPPTGDSDGSLIYFSPRTLKTNALWSPSDNSPCVLPLPPHGVPRGSAPLTLAGWFSTPPLLRAEHGVTCLRWPGKKPLHNAGKLSRR